MDVETVVTEILTKVLGSHNEIETMDKKTHPDWDSLASISILFELEERFEIEFSDSQIEELTSFSTICETVRQLKTEH